MSEGATCPNIGPRGIDRRRRGGLLALAASIVLAAALLIIDAPWWTMLLLFLPFWSAGLGLLQAREKT